MPAFDCAGCAGVRHGSERQLGDRAHALDGREHDLRAFAAVAADGARAPLLHQPRGIFRGGPVKAVAVRVDRDHGDHGQVRGLGTCGAQHDLSLVHGHDGLYDEQIGADARAAFGERADLFGEGLVGLVPGHLCVCSKTHADGTDGTCDKGFARLFFAHLRDALAGEAYAGQVEVSGAGL